MRGASASDGTTSLPSQAGKGAAGARLCRHFISIALVAVIAILLVAAAGLRLVFRNFVVDEAEASAIRISRGLRDRELGELVVAQAVSGALLAVPDEALPALDRQMRVLMEPFNLVKIKVFDVEGRIV